MPNPSRPVRRLGQCAHPSVTESAAVDGMATAEPESDAAEAGCCLNARTVVDATVWVASLPVAVTCFADESDGDVDDVVTDDEADEASVVVEAADTAVISTGSGTAVVVDGSEG